MLQTYINMLVSNSLGKCLAKTIVSIAYGLLLSKRLTMRQIGLYLPVEGQKQSRVNRVWRFFHKMKMEQKDFYVAFVRMIPKIVTNRYVIIDYTALRGYNVMLFIASMPYKGRSIPFYGKVLRLKDLDNRTYLSKNDFLECCMDEVLAIVPFSPVVIGDREFGTHWFLTYLEGKGVGYVIRIAKNRVVSEYGMNIEVSKLSPGKHLVQWRGLNFYIGKRDNPKKKDNFWIVAYSKDLVNMNSLHIAWTYLKRFQCEEMHRELKSRLNLLSLNKQRYYKEAYNPEIVNKFLMVLITAFFIGLYIGGLFKHRYKEHLNVIVSYDKELSLFGIGLFIISIMNTPNSENFRFTPRLLKTIRLSLQRRI